MKYYKNLIERKKYSVITISICTVLVGIFVCYLSVKDVCLIENLHFQRLGI